MIWPDLLPQLSPEEQAAVLVANDNTEKTQANGVRLAGVKYLTVQANERSIYGKKSVRCISSSCNALRC